MLIYSVVALFVLMPLALLTSHSLPSGIFYISVALALVLLVKQRFAGAWEQTRTYSPLIVSYGILFAAVALSSALHGDWAGANGEGALRFFLGLWLFVVALPAIERPLLWQAVWGLLLGGLVSALVILWLTFTVRIRPDTPALILTTYSSITLLCAAISVYALKVQLTSWPRFEFLLKLAVACVAFIAFVVAQTRTGFLGLPAFILIGVILFCSFKKPVKAVSTLVVVAGLLAAAGLSNHGIQKRLSDAYNEAISCQQENYPSSICIRIQLWRAAVDAGVSHPLSGLGDGGEFADYVAEVAVPKGLVGKATVDIYFGEPHNDVLLMFAAFGIPGALGLLLIYFAPCFYFVPRLVTGHSNTIRVAAAMGLAVCLGFAFFGISETMFRRMNTMGFYTMLVALFIVLSTSKGSEAPRLS